MQIERLMELIQRKPFKLVGIVLVNGERIEVRREQEILFPPYHPELIIVFTVDRVIHYFEYTMIASLDTE